MKNPKVSVTLIAIVDVLAVIFALSTEDRPEQHGLTRIFQGLKNKVANQNSAVKLKDSAEAETEDKDSNVSSAVDMSGEEKAQELAVFLESEARSLDNAHTNTKEKQTALQERANKLDDVEKNQLKSVTLNNNRPINERILSVFLLGLSQGGAAQSLASEIAQAPLPDYGPSSPHSEAEIRNTQELALRYMAIDKLVQDYKSNPADSPVATEALNILKNQSVQNPIPQVRKYAIDELSKINRSH